MRAQRTRRQATTGAALSLSLALAVAALHAPARSQERERAVTIAATGDVLLHIKVNKAAAARGYGHLFQGIAHELPEAHVAFANLETPLVDDVADVETGSPPVLGSRIEAAAAMAEAGFDVLGCANNHAFDQSSDGARRTIRAVREAGMIAVGVEEDEDALFVPQRIVREGVRIAFLSVTDGLNRGAGRPVRANLPYLIDLIALIS